MFLQNKFVVYTAVWNDEKKNLKIFFFFFLFKFWESRQICAISVLTTSFCQITQWKSCQPFVQSLLTGVFTTTRD